MSDQKEVTIRGLKDAFNKLNPNEKRIVFQALDNINIDLIVPNEDLTGKRVRGFFLEEKKYEAESYIDVLRKILKIVLLRHPLDGNRILSIRGRKNKYFSLNQNELRMPELIRGTTIYFETNENAKSICIRCEKILKLYDMDYLSFKIEYYN